MQPKQKKFSQIADNSGVKVFVFSLMCLIAICLMAYVIYTINDNSEYHKTVATVGDQRISLEEFNYFLKMARDNRLLPAEAIEKIYDWDDKKAWSLEVDGRKISDMLKESALDLASRYKVEVQKAREKEISLSEDDYDAVENEIEIKKVAGAGNEKEKLQFYKYSYGMSSVESYRKLAENLKLTGRFKNSVMQEMELSEKEVKDYYENKYNAPEGREIRQITFNTTDDKGNMLSESNLAEIDRKIDEILTRAINKEDFALLVKEYSEDTDERQNGGLKVVADRETEYELMTVLGMNALSPGEVLGPVKLKNAKCVIRFEGFVKAVQPLEKVRRQVEIELKKDTYNSLLEQWLNEKEIKINKKVYEAITLE